MIKTLVKKLKNLLKSEKIIDIIIFGSTVKGSLKTSDLDIMLLSNNADSRSELKDRIERLIEKKIDLQIINFKDYDKFIWITMIREGFSVKHNDYLHNIYRLKPANLYKYSLKGLTSSKKVMFDRAIKTFKGINKLSNRVVIVPVELSGEFSDFLRGYNIDIESEEYYLLPLVRKEDL